MVVGVSPYPSRNLRIGSTFEALSFPPSSLLFQTDIIQLKPEDSGFLIGTDEDTIYIIGFKANFFKRKVPSILDQF